MKTVRIALISLHVRWPTAILVNAHEAHFFEPETDCIKDGWPRLLVVETRGFHCVEGVEGPALRRKLARIF